MEWILKKIVIVDYGMGNISSVYNALEFISPSNTKIYVSSERSEIKSADKIIFPGQGAAKSSIKSLKKFNIIDDIKESATKKPFLGICLGMQVLMDVTEENEGTQWLGLVEGGVKKFKVSDTNFKVPHMGWNKINQKGNHEIWNEIPDNSYFYFVHSYFVVPEEKNIQIGLTSYDKDFCSVLTKKNIVAIQGHPEKSGQVGIQFLKNFIGM